jgi:hypothetical protein
MEMVFEEGRKKLSAPSLRRKMDNKNGAKPLAPSSAPWR